MAEAKIIISASLPHKDTEGRECVCSATIDHHRNDEGKDCSCLIGRDHHKNSVGENCSCRIWCNHNTKPSLHKDYDGRTCNGPFTFEKTTPGKRRCSYCRREETYHRSDLVIAFKKGVMLMQAESFVSSFKIDGHALVVARGEPKAIVEKNGIVAITVSIPAASKKSAEDWICGIEECGPVQFASRVVVVGFPEIPSA